MKIKYVFLSTILAMAFTLTLFGQHNDTTKADMKKHHMSKMMGKPKVDVTVDGLHMKVWLMTQKHHKKLMKEMKHNGMKMKDTSMAMGKDIMRMKHHNMEMNKEMMDSMTAGTHHIMLEVKDAVSGKEISNASASVLIISPSKKSTSVDLKSMMNHFGGALTLDEKGEYQFTVSVNVDGVSKSTQFQYKVK
ncbi:MAG: hypothetical protein ACYC49_10935 [Ignavibacteriaceae bacterium]